MPTLWRVDSCTHPPAPHRGSLLPAFGLTRKSERWFEIVQRAFRSWCSEGCRDSAEAGGYGMHHRDLAGSVAKRMPERASARIVKANVSPLTRRCTISNALAIILYGKLNPVKL